MARVLMLVHGMGVHGADWATDVKADIVAAAQTFGLDGGFSETLDDDAVTLVPISYDARFRKWLDKWGNDSRELVSFIKKNSIKVPANIVGWLENVDATENNFLWSHVVDVILYRFFDLVTTDVRVSVAKDIAQTWRDALKVDPQAEVSVLAHSLGTSVTHDTLALLATAPPPKATGFLAGDRRLANVFMVANVGRILETSPQVFDSVICPPSVRANGYCGTMFNVRHDLDPFPAPRPFKPGWGGDDFVQIRTKAVREFNVHDFQHYLRDPRVHVPLLRSLFGFDAISPASAQEAMDAYEAARGSTCPERLAAFVQDCRQRVQLIEDSSDVKTLISAGAHFLADVQEIKAACAGGP
jgi:hypothetical protein